MYLLFIVVALHASFKLPVVPAIQWKLQEASVTFKIKNAGLTVNGTLGGLQTNIQFDPANVKESAITASLDANTIDTGIGARDKHLRKETYFHADKYPKITIRSTSLEATGVDTYRGNFDLTIKNTTKKIKMPFTFTPNRNTGVFKGDFELNRLDFQIGETSWLLADNVRIAIQITVTQ